MNNSGLGLSGQKELENINQLCCMIQSLETP